MPPRRDTRGGGSVAATATSAKANNSNNKKGAAAATAAAPATTTMLNGVPIPAPTAADKRVAREYPEFALQLRDLHLKLKECGSDGNCLFRAVADQVHNIVLNNGNRHPQSFISDI